MQFRYYLHVFNVQPFAIERNISIPPQYFPLESDFLVTFSTEYVIKPSAC